MQKGSALLAVFCGGGFSVVIFLQICKNATFRQIFATFGTFSGDLFGAYRKNK
ncbi:MAG: hypothetical protein ACI4AM_07925 [Muribaculaceae bacterium]